MDHAVSIGSKVKQVLTNRNKRIRHTESLNEDEK